MLHKLLSRSFFPNCSLPLGFPPSPSSPPSLPPSLCIPLLWPSPQRRHAARGRGCAGGAWRGLAGLFESLRETPLPRQDWKEAKRRRITRHGNRMQRESVRKDGFEGERVCGILNVAGGFVCVCVCVCVWGGRERDGEASGSHSKDTLSTAMTKNTTRWVHWRSHSCFAFVLYSWQWLVICSGVVQGCCRPVKLGGTRQL